jgi:aerobic carbon-monoxide dehydrogenase small subunit
VALPLASSNSERSRFQLRLFVPKSGEFREVCPAELNLEWERADAALLEVLQNAGIQSLRRGCSDQKCGACRVLLNAELIASCAVAAVNVPTDSILETFEQLRGQPVAVRAIQAFESERTTRCRLCIPGLAIMAVDLRRKNQLGDREALDACVAGAHCQCTGRGSLRRALASAADGE